MDIAWLSVLLFSFAWSSALHIYQPPSWPLALVLLLFALACSRNKRHCLAVPLAQGAVLPFYYIWAARQHAETLFPPIAAAMLNLFGIEAVAEGHLLYVDSYLRTFVLASTWEKAGALWLVLLLAGGLATLALKKAGAKHYAGFLAFTCVYALLRYVLLLALYATYYLHGLFWERVLNFATFIPYALVLAFFFQSLPFSVPVAVEKRKAIISGVLAFMLVLSGVAFFGFRDPGREKAGRVLVDEYHSDWEWTTDIYDEQWFGERSGYNYYCFFNYLDKFYTTERNMDIITAATLRDVDVFIMKTPTRPFAEAELTAMIDFVTAGGGLYLIGDHTNVFGTGVNLNQIAQNFGITFNYDCTYELTHGNLSEYEAPRILPHSVVRKLPHFLFATSNTLDAKWQAEEVMLGYGLKGLQADYSQKNFFPADTNSPTLEHGLFLQSAAVQHGKGRVLAFTDSTVFSNFWMFMPGKPELLLGSVEWLNRENTLIRTTPRQITSLAIALMLAANIFWAYKNRHSLSPAVFLLAGVAAIIVGMALFQPRNSLPEPIKPMTEIRFEREYSRFKLPNDLDGFLSNMDEQLNTFYVWTQRLDYFPGVDERLLTALENGDLAVMAKPGREIKNPQQVIEAVEAGAKLLILDDLASGGYSNSLLELAGMKLVAAGDGSAVQGGEELLDGLCRVQKIGMGLIAVFADPDLFYSLELGDVSANLTEKTEKLTNMEFELLRELLK